MSSAYGQVVVEWVQGRGEPLVTLAQSPALCSVELLRKMAAVHFVGPDLIRLGTDKFDRPVHYRIHGWDPLEKALIIYREVVE